MSDVVTYIPKDTKVLEIKVFEPYFLTNIKRVNKPEKKHFFGFITDCAEIYVMPENCSDSSSFRNCQTEEDVLKEMNRIYYDDGMDFLKNRQIWRKGVIHVNFDKIDSKKFYFETEKEKNEIINHLCSLTDMVKL